MLCGDQGGITQWLTHPAKNIWCCCAQIISCEHGDIVLAADKLGHLSGIAGFIEARFSKTNAEG